jgi:hypothetical protein
MTQVVKVRVSDEKTDTPNGVVTYITEIREDKGNIEEISRTVLSYQMAEHLAWINGLTLSV